MSGDTPRLGPVDTSPPPDSAGGIPAVVSLTKVMIDHMGPLEGLQALLALNQTDGFDCPGCAWPDPKHRGRLEFCENGAKAVADEATRYRVDPAFFARHSIAELATWPDHELNKAGRLTHPMVREPGATHYTPISWDDAFARIGTALQAVAPDEAVFYTSGRTSNEAAFLYQLFVRAYGTNNLPDCSNMCHESSGRGLGDTVGVGKGSVLLEDFDEAELILVVGHNPGTNHPRMLTALQDAKRNGCTIVSINPLREPALVRFKHPKEVAGTIGSGTAISDLYLQVAIGGDIALLTGVFKHLYALEASRGDVLDHAFIADKTAGYDDFAASVAAADWDRIVADSGIPRADIERLADLVARHDRFITCWAMGITQHEHGVANVQTIVNLHLLRGALGKPGAGLCPVRGHSNVQGDRTMGIWERPSAKLLDALKAEFDFEPPRAHGLDVVHAIKAMHAGTAKVFFAMGGNFLSASPDTDYTAEALQNCALTVQVSTKLNRAHLVTGDAALILPCLGRTERDEQPGGRQFVTVENSMGIVHTSRGKRAPASAHLLSEPRIVARLAEATLPDHPIDWSGLADDYGRIRDHISRVIGGFEDYNRRVVQPGGFALPHPVRDSLTFPTPSGKAHFTVHDLPDMGRPDGALWMFTVRSHDQYNTTIYATDDRYRGIRGERRVVLMHTADMRERGLSEGDRVTLVSHFRGEQRRAPEFRVVAFDVPKGSAATYFPEANVLVPVDSYARKSHTPTSKAVLITVESPT